MRHLLLFLLLFISFSFSTPVQAADVTATSRETLLAQIEILLKQIDVLQELLAAKKAGEANEIYETIFFSTDFDAIYKTVGTDLVRLDHDTSPQTDHQILWSWFVDMIGEDAITLYIDEFRTYNEPNSAIDGFVEVKPHFDGGDRNWVLSVNMDGFVINNQQSRDIFTDLLMHEYAHILLYESPEFVDAYTEAFWTRSDHTHARALAGMDLADSDDLLEDYYDSRKDEFVSDYATLNPDEDLAETFTVFVEEDKPATTQTKIDEKITFFYQEPLFRKVRTSLRDNLDIH